MKNSKKKMREEVDPLDSDLSHLLAEGTWQKVRFEFKPKNKVVTIRMSEELLEAIKKQAKKSGIDFQKFIRLTLEKILLKPS